MNSSQIMPSDGWPTRIPKREAVSVPLPESVLEQWDYEKNKQDPKSLTVFSNSMAWWICPKCGGSFNALPSVLSKPGEHCPYCKNYEVLAGYNDLATIRPDIAAEWHPTLNRKLTPSDVMPHERERRWWLCPDCGAEYQCTTVNRCFRASACACRGTSRDRARGVSTRVRRLEDKQAFWSLGAAARFCHGSADHIKRVLDKEDRTAYGFHWQSIRQKKRKNES